MRLNDSLNFIEILEITKIKSDIQMNSCKKRRQNFRIFKEIFQNEKNNQINTVTNPLMKAPLILLIRNDII